MYKKPVPVLKTIKKVVKKAREKKKYDLNEKIINVGFNASQEPNREKYRQQVHDVIQKSYKNVEGGYGGHGSGSDAESKAIHADISDHAIKATKRGSDITHATIYKKSKGRKIIGLGTSGTEQGKADWKKTAEEDKKKKRAWGEFSGKAERAYKSVGFAQKSSARAGELTGKNVNIVDRKRYTRNIGGHEHEKTILGYPSKNK